NDNVPNFEAMINAAVANALPNLTAALRTQITNDIKNGAGPSGGGGGDAIPHGIHVWIKRTVIFGNVCQPEFVYHGSSPLKFVKLISAMKARTLISHGCQERLIGIELIPGAEPISKAPYRMAPVELKE
nr:hypothetical protein [Tanacetum cinerariifolium]